MLSLQFSPDGRRLFGVVSRYRSDEADSGSVRVAWHLDAMGDLRLEWREQGGPPVQPPRRQGFGTTIITRSVPYDLKGTADVRFVVE